MRRFISILALSLTLAASTAQAGKFDFIRGLGKSGDDVARQADEVDGGGGTLEGIGDAAGDAAGLAIDGASAVSGSSDEEEHNMWLVAAGAILIGGYVLWQMYKFIKWVGRLFRRRR